MAETYKCAQCGGEFELGWSNDEAMAERDALWQREVAVGMAFDVVCDDCFQKFEAWRNGKDLFPTATP